MNFISTKHCRIHPLWLLQMTWMAASHFLTICPPGMINSYVAHMEEALYTDIECFCLPLSNIVLAAPNGGDGRSVRQLLQVRGFLLQRQLLNIYQYASGKATSTEQLKGSCLGACFSSLPFNPSPFHSLHGLISSLFCPQVLLSSKHVRL